MGWGSIVFLFGNGRWRGSRGGLWRLLLPRPLKQLIPTQLRIVQDFPDDPDTQLFALVIGNGGASSIFMTEKLVGTFLPNLDESMEKKKIDQNPGAQGRQFSLPAPRPPVR